jgi:hypothetical protein
MIFFNTGGPAKFRNPRIKLDMRGPYSSDYEGNCPLECHAA